MATEKEYLKGNDRPDIKPENYQNGNPSFIGGYIGPLTNVGSTEPLQPTKPSLNG